MSSIKSSAQLNCYTYSVNPVSGIWYYDFNPASLAGIKLTALYNCTAPLQPLTKDVFHLIWLLSIYPHKHLNHRRSQQWYHYHACKCDIITVIVVKCCTNCNCKARDGRKCKSYIHSLHIWAIYHQNCYMLIQYIHAHLAAITHGQSLLQVRIGKDNYRFRSATWN